MRLIHKYLAQDELLFTGCHQDIYHWLVHVKAFTPELKRLGQKVHLDLISQSVESLYEDEIAILSASHTRNTAMVRKVMIFADEKPACYARVAISDQILKHQKIDFESLGTKPIGETLFFGRSDTVRDRFCYFKLQDASGLHKEMPPYIQNHICYWGRQSVFSNSNGEVLVTEVFLL